MPFPPVYVPAGEKSMQSLAIHSRLRKPILSLPVSLSPSSGNSSGNVNPNNCCFIKIHRRHLPNSLYYFRINFSACKNNRGNEQNHTAHGGSFNPIPFFPQGITYSDRGKRGEKPVTNPPLIAHGLLNRILNLSIFLNRNP